MTLPVVPQTDLGALPRPRDVCVFCDAPWSDRERCPQCGLHQSEVEALLRGVGRAFETARNVAKEGRYHEARRLLRSSGALDLPPGDDAQNPDGHDAARRLDALCAAVTGDWDHLVVGALPPQWRQAVNSEPVRADYEQARHAAQRQDWQAAGDLVRRCLDIAPWLLPAQKLRLLSLHGAGAVDQAERSRQVLLREAPAEPDLCRYQFAREALENIRTAGVAERLWVSAAAGGAAFVLVAAMVFGPLRLGSAPSGRLGIVAPPPPPISGQPPPPPALTPASGHPSPNVGRGGWGVRAGADLPLAADLQRESEQSRREAQFQQARRWFNAGVHALAAGESRAAERLATGAFLLGKNSYLEDEALLLRARAIARQPKADAAAAYALIADKTPRSAYAPLGLFRAAQTASRRGRRQDAERYVRRLRAAYSDSPEAARAAALARPSRSTQDSNP